MIFLNYLLLTVYFLVPPFIIVAQSMFVIVVKKVWTICRKYLFLEMVYEQGEQLIRSGWSTVLLLFAMMRPVVKSFKVPVVEVGEPTNHVGYSMDLYLDHYYLFYM